MNRQDGEEEEEEPSASSSGVACLTHSWASIKGMEIRDTLRGSSFDIKIMKQLVIIGKEGRVAFSGLLPLLLSSFRRT